MKTGQIFIFVKISRSSNSVKRFVNNNDLTPFLKEEIDFFNMSHIECYFNQ